MSSLQPRKVREISLLRRKKLHGRGYDRCYVPFLARRPAGAPAGGGAPGSGLPTFQLHTRQPYSLPGASQSYGDSHDPHLPDLPGLRGRERLRIFIHAAAYILMHSIRERALKGICMEKASILSIRERLLLCAVSVRTLKTKVILDFAKHHPMKDELRHMIHYYSIRDVG